MTDFLQTIHSLPPNDNERSSPNKQRHVMLLNLDSKKPILFIFSLIYTLFMIVFKTYLLSSLNFTTCSLGYWYLSDKHCSSGAPDLTGTGRALFLLRALFLPPSLQFHAPPYTFLFRWIASSTLTQFSMWLFI